mgnify:CR=1 FL=1
MRPAPAFNLPSLKRPLSSDGAESLPSKLFAATINGSPAPSPRRREASHADAKRTRGGEEDVRRRQMFATTLTPLYHAPEPPTRAPTPLYHAPEPPTRAPTPAPEPGVPATWLGLVRSLDGSSLEPLLRRSRRPPR